MRRFGQPRSDNRPQRLLLGVHPVPTMVTLGNLLCGFASIVLAMRSYIPPRGFYQFGEYDCLYWSGILIFGAMVFDVMDGKVARWTKSTSKFGMEMDSLSDVVSFGVAPAVLIKAMIDLELFKTGTFPLQDRYVWPMLATYVCCAALRLARYNVEAQTGHRDYFFGMPSPGAAGCAASLAILIIPGSHHLAITQLHDQLGRLDDWRRQIHQSVLLALPFVLLLLGVLMVTRIHYPHLGDRLLRGRKSFMHIMVLGLGLVLIVMHHEIMLAAVFNGYLLYGIGNELRFQVFPSQRPAGWAATAEAAAPASLGDVAHPAAASPPDGDKRTSAAPPAPEGAERAGNVSG
ncbi:MAG: CDP-alcohol phosphatidyltransferase family protein [Planctomycetota bacterium]|nr:CDP-alcohol phosphatidyltransferase family protein [Planctomycetota bacterium]